MLDLIDIMMSDDKTARKISLNGQNYAREHLAPHHILGYYLLLFQVSLNIHRAPMHFLSFKQTYDIVNRHSAETMVYY